MAKTKRKFSHKDLFNFGWIVDSDHPIIPKQNKEFWIDVLIGIGITAIGIAYGVNSAFYHGAHAFEDAEFDILVDTGKIQLLDGEKSDSDEDTIEQ